MKKNYVDNVVKITGTVPEHVAVVLDEVAGYAGYSLFYRPVKKKKEKKELTLQQIFDEIQYRFTGSNFSLYETFETDLTRYTFVWHPEKGYKVGSSRCNPSDSYNYYAGYYLALCRACGWKDLEEQLVSKL